MRRRSLVGLLLVVLLPLILNPAGGDPVSPGYAFARLSGPYADSVIGWMARSTLDKVVDAARSQDSAGVDVPAFFRLAGRAARLNELAFEPSRADASQVGAPTKELPSLESELDGLSPGVESLLQKQVGAALADAGLGYPLAGRLFPPLFFRFEALPKLLVVSPRSRIDRVGAVLLRPDITVADAERIEADVSSKGYSALVTQIGGLGVYPSMVPESSDLQETLRTVAHEWTHQFLAFRPLGWRYAFGAEGDARMVTINETAAEIVGREIGDEVYLKYYAAGQPPATGRSPREQRFRQLMREIRVRVDGLLAEGRVDEAEGYMEQARSDLARQGYYLRKLNQAYFAFYGNYADDPSMASRVGRDIAARIHALRDRSPSLGDFLWKVSSAGSYAEFLKLAPAP